MKMIDGVHPPRGVRADPDRAAREGIPSLSISEVKGSGRQKGIVEHYRGSTLTVNVRPKLKLESSSTTRTSPWWSRRSSSTPGRVRSATGRSSSLPVEEAIRIRTGEEGEEVLQAHTEAEIPA